MKLVRSYPEQLGWEHGPLHIVLSGEAIHLVSAHAEGLNFLVTPTGMELLVGTPERLMQALIALALKDPPSRLADIATNSAAIFAQLPVRSIDGA